MEINNHICFDKSELPLLFDYLIKNNIAHEVSLNRLVSFDVYESSSQWPYIKSFYEKYNLFCICDTHFSKDELQNAQWLTVRSKWLNGYPQPENNFKYETITYSNDNYCKECGAGLVQVDSFRIRKEPKWSTKNFMMLNWVFDEIFLNIKAKNILEENDITGISFLPVKNSRGDIILDNIFQLIINTKIDNGLIDDQPHIREMYVCESCGTKKYISNGKGMLKYKKEVFENVFDIVKSSELFGSGKVATNEIFVNQKVYKLLSDNKLDRALCFEPIELV